MNQPEPPELKFQYSVASLKGTKKEALLKKIDEQNESARTSRA